ncbi:MAG: ABC transporter substrate-binding protein, partial [Actinobacteria bacterium]|nr:ABC transporter substrate-binding protein [Actinomycetota bacterium]
GVYNALITGGNTNLVKYSRPKVDKWLNEARQTDNTATRRKLYNQIQEQVAHDVVYIPLLFDYWGNVFSDKVSGLSTPDPSSLGIIRPGELYLKK